MRNRQPASLQREMSARPGNLFSARHVRADHAGPEQNPMTTFLLVLAIVTLVVNLAAGSEFLLGSRSICWLNEVPPLMAASGPRVSVIIAARDEERRIATGLASVLAQDYGDLEFIAIDDRSSDGTGAILDRFAATDARLRVVHVDQLPAGWLGKNHALQLGAEAATGELLLFTDADVEMAPSTLRRAVAYMLGEGLDHLVVAPRVELPSIGLRAVFGTFALHFNLAKKPWKARDPRSRASMGIGPFNLVRAAAYRRAGTHRPIAMRPDDDVMLGKLLKKKGCKQEMVFGGEAVIFEWYRSVPELIQGLAKNSFAALGYNVPTVLAATAAQVLLYVWPAAAVVATGGAVRWINLATWLSFGLVGLLTARFTHSPRWNGLVTPLATLLFVYIVWRSALIALWRRGISWRGTHYDLAELRANKV
jgi:glycosyltransferase involved in cell wall biosynthesis